MNLWVDDIRPAPHGYMWLKSVYFAKLAIENIESCYYRTLYDEYKIEIIDIDYDAGDYAHLGGDYIELLIWFEVTKRDYPIRIHSMNSVGIANMRRIIARNGWKEVK